MALRAEIAGLPKEKFVIAENDEAVISQVAACNNRVFALCTYTAMTELRKTMYKKKIVKEMWQ